MKEKKPLAEILAGKHPTFPTAKLKIKLLASGLKQNICEGCGNTGHHNGKPLTLQLDHADGNNTNHVLSNLRLLCPNCHSQTETYSGRNKTNAFRTKLSERAEARKKLSDERQQKIEARSTAKKQLVRQRLDDLASMKYEKGTISKLSEQWNVSHTQVRRFILDFCPEFMVSIV